MVGLPTFTTTTSPGDASATAVGTGTGPYFCGIWQNGPRVLHVLTGDDCDNFDNKDVLARLLRHEVGHAVGWTGLSTDKVIFDTDAADHCVMNLPDDGSINEQICAHEIEGALAAYGLVSYNASTFFSTPFVVSSQLALHSQTVPIGQTVTLSPGPWRLERGGFVAGTENSYQWTTSNASVATVAGGVVTAQAAGTATITARPTSSGSYLFAHPFPTTGRTATITVPQPSPQILLDEVPVYTATYHTFTYQGPGGPGALAWSIDDSRTTLINPDTTFTTPGWTASVYIDAGSYTLRVSAGGVTQDFPVCTYGSSLRGGTGGKGGAGTNAVEGCPPPGGPPENE